MVVQEKKTLWCTWTLTFLACCVCLFGWLVFFCLFVSMGFLFFLSFFVGGLLSLYVCVIVYTTLQ